MTSLKTKGDATHGTREWILHGQKMTKTEVITLRSDGAKEFIEGATKAFLDSNGTVLDDVLVRCVVYV